MAFYVKRLKQGLDLRNEIGQLIAEHTIQAGYIASAVGSLDRAKLRLAGEAGMLELDGPLEIVSATGTVGVGGMHIHISVSDSDGKTLGGHLVEGCIIRTTAEIVITAVEDFEFNRRIDPATGYLELDASSSSYL